MRKFRSRETRKPGIPNSKAFVPNCHEKLLLVNEGLDEDRLSYDDAGTQRSLGPGVLGREERETHSSFSEKSGSGWGLRDGITKDLGPHSPNFMHGNSNT